MGAAKNNVVLITGGAGFIGSNLAQRLLTESNAIVRIFDNLSRRGVLHNLKWLRTLPGSSRLEIVQGDIRHEAAVQHAACDVDEIFHLAAQVAVTSSVESPALDFETNAFGTLNVLEAARRGGRHPFLLFTSTNKVYGSLEDVPVSISGSRYVANHSGFRGVTENAPLDFHSPYGCSKGAADQYVRDYARIYGLDTVVFRMSCIAGPRQFGNEDQGWVAHFLYSVVQGLPITIFGDGFQVRDVLHVHDLIDAMMAARARRKTVRGEIYNVGGGIAHSISVIEMLRECERRTGLPLHLDYVTVRPGDQPLYISDTTRLTDHTGWRPRRSLNNILASIEAFWLENQEHIGSPSAQSSVATLLQAEVA